MKNYSFYVLTFFLLSFIPSCKKRETMLLEYAGENRKEIERIITIYNNDSDQLTQNSALFLTQNMPFHYSYPYNVSDKFDSLFMHATMQADNIKSKYIENNIEQINLNSTKRINDLRMISYNYLSRMINHACNTWKHCQWKGNYTNDIFFEYVLPYKIGNETPSLWYDEIDKQFPILNEFQVISRRGIQYEADEAILNKCKKIEIIGSSSKKCALMINPNSSISFKVKVNREIKKRLILKFSSAKANLSATVKVNGITIDTIYLPKTRNLETFNEKWVNKPLDLSTGINNITITNVSDSLILDYIQLGSIEKFKRNDLKDFTKYTFTIINKKNNNCITFNKETDQNCNIIWLEPIRKNDFNQICNLDYLGYPIWRISPNNIKIKDCCVEVKFGNSKTLEPGTPTYNNKFENRPFQQWIIIPSHNGYYRIMNKHSGLFLQTIKDSTIGKDYLGQADYNCDDSQLWKFKKINRRFTKDSDFKIGSSLSEALRVFDLTHQFHFFSYSNGIPLKSTTIIKSKEGKCIDEAEFTVLLCRYLGIPSTVDFTPHWGNRSQSHSWCTIIKPDKKGTPFYMGNVPGDTIHLFHSYRKPKVFRKRFSINRDIASSFRYEKEYPNLFHLPTFTDVTSEYCQTSDITLSVPDSISKDNRVAYICVFDDMDWIPVYYGIIKDQKVKFKYMGRDILYIAGTYENNKIQPFCNPFILTDKGCIREIKIKNSELQEMKLLRKHPFWGEQDFFNYRMNNGCFQGANTKDFSDAVTLYTHKGITNGNWYDIKIFNSKKFKYLRYIGSKGSYCNINELEFYNHNRQLIKGKIIGTTGENWAKKENVFDNNILTGFCGNSPDGHWIGLELQYPQSVLKIRYIGRNDGNCIEKGDAYELYAWNDNKWCLVNFQEAKGDSLLFEKIPTNGLYLLKDKSKGIEERIFTYEKGKQVWW